MKLPNPDEQSANRLTATGALIESATFGHSSDQLDPDVQKVCAWAQSNDLLDALFLLIDASATGRRPKYLGTVLHFLASPIPRALLKTWEIERDYLENIGALADAFAFAPEMRRAFPAIPSAAPLFGQRLHGDLTGFPVVMLTARPISNSLTDAHIWIETMRTWCVIEFLENARNDAPPPERLVDIAQKLRLGIDTSNAKREWLDLFLSLKVTSKGLYELRSQLMARASLIYGNMSEKATAHAQFLLHLNRLDKPDSNNRGPVFAFSKLYLHAMRKRAGLGESTPAPDWSDWDNAETHGEWAGATQLEQLQSQGSHEIPGYPLDPTRTPAEHERASHGLHLLTLEEQQRLPLSWEKPNTDERERLGNWIRTNLSGDDGDQRRMAVLVFLAAQTAHSVRRALDIEVSGEPSNDWRLDPDTLTLHRLPPRRRAAVQLDSKGLAHVRPAAQRLVIHPPEEVKACLAELLQAHPPAKELKAWYGEPLEVLRQLRASLESAGLKRITPAMTAGWWAQEVFEQSLDPVLTQLLTSNSRSGMSGACAYASYGEEIRSPALLMRGDGSMTILPLGAGPELNCAGSPLDAHDTWLRQCFADARVRVLDLASPPDKWVDHHNAVVTYILGVLFAGTGARPVLSPFQAASDFDLQAGTVYVEDKVTSNLHKGRLLPLPDVLRRLVRDLYLPHLKRLAGIVRVIDERLSQDIHRLHALQNSTRLPFFFLLEVTNGTLRHLEPSEVTLNATGTLRLELPWNVFRHRQSTFLKRQGVDHEVINGLLGHAENGTSTWGPYSSRTWQEDTDAVRPHLETSLAALDIEMLPVAATPPKPEALAALKSPIHQIESEPYGREAREQRKHLAQESARRQAREEITRFVHDLNATKAYEKKAPALTADELDRLARQMLYRADHLPHPRATLRYQEFTDWVERNWESDRPRLKKRYLPRLEEASPFSSLAATAAEVCRLANEWFVGGALRDKKHNTQVRLALVAAIAGLIIESRVANRKVIGSLAKNKDYRLVRLGQRYFLEHAEHLDKHPDAPVSRYAISRRSAHRFSVARASTYTVDLTTQPPDEAYAGLARLLALESIAPSYDALFGRLAHIVGQLNWQQLPGLVAGYLDGSVTSVGLEHHDWLRLRTGTGHEVALTGQKSWSAKKDGQDLVDEEWGLDDGAADRPNAEFIPAVDVLATAGAAPSTPTKNTGRASPRSQAQDAPPKNRVQRVKAKPKLEADLEDPSPNVIAQRSAQKLLRQVRQVLTSVNNRRDLDAAIRRALEECSDASTTCRIFTDWVRSLLWQKTKPHRFLALRSVQRYFFALSGCFEQVAYDHNLALLDEDEVTDFYANIMDARRRLKEAQTSAHQNGQASESDPAAADLLETASATLATSAEDQIYKTWRLALSCLRKFHRFAQHHYEIEEPDWSEVGEDEAALSIAPRLLLEKEYRHALGELVGEPQTADLLRTSNALILMFTMRFGLRGEEATGLMQSDWVVGPGPARMVLVQSNALRSLKTISSRRQVPLLFPLTEFEASILARHQDLLMASGGTGGNGAWFNHLAGPNNRAASKAARSAISEQLKRTTGNPRTSLHAARHSFANMVAMALLNVQPHVWRHMVMEVPTASRLEHMRRTTLGTHTSTRRIPWALARLMGHSHPRTAIKSYVHLLPDLAYSSISWVEDPTAQNLREKRLEQVLDLDQAQTQGEYLTPFTGLVPRVDLRQPTALNTLRALRLMQQGVNLERIGGACDLTKSQVELLQKLIADIDAILRAYPTFNATKRGTSALLSHISESRFRALIEIAERASYEDVDELAALDPSSLQPTRLVGKSRQVVLFDRPQFQFLADLLKRWGIPQHSLQLISSRKIAPRLIEWAAEAGFAVTPAEDIEVSARAGKRSSTERASGKSSRRKIPRNKAYYQLDWVETDDKGGRSSHRCVAAPAETSNSLLTGRHELVTLVAAHLFHFHCARSRS